jgi:predicted methyltransferase
MYNKRISSIARLSMSMVLTTGWATFLTNTAHAQDVAGLLETAIYAPHRSDANRVRDQYRHPKETLHFLAFNLP